MAVVRGDVTAGDTLTSLAPRSVRDRLALTMGQHCSRCERRMPSIVGERVVARPRDFRHPDLRFEPASAIALGSPRVGRAPCSPSVGPLGVNERLSGGRPRRDRRRSPERRRRDPALRTSFARSRPSVEPALKATSSVAKPSSLPDPFARWGVTWIGRHRSARDSGLGCSARLAPRVLVACTSRRGNGRFETPPTQTRGDHPLPGDTHTNLGAAVEAIGPWTLTEPSTVRFHGSSGRVEVITGPPSGDALSQVLRPPFRVKARVPGARHAFSRAAFEPGPSRRRFVRAALSCGAATSARASVP